MDTWILVVVVLVFCFFAWRYWKRAKLAGERAAAISEYASQFSRVDSRRLHDLALTNLVTSPQQGLDASQALEIVVALRDRVDELDGRAHGPSNKVRIRAALALAVVPLLKQDSLTASVEVRRQFALGERIPEGEYERLGLHISMMGRVYQHLRNAPRLPELEKYSSHQ